MTEYTHPDLDPAERELIDPSSACVLIIDDDAVDRAAICKLLDNRYRLVEADTAKAGLRTYETEQPACVLLDYHLPDTEGLATLDALVAKDAPVIVLTGVDSETLGMEALKHGAQDYCLKSSLNARMAERMVAYAMERRRLIASTRAALYALRESEQRFNDIATRIAEGLWVRNANGSKCLYLSPNFERIWGRSMEEMNRTLWVNTVHPDDRLAGREAFLKAQRAGTDYRNSYRIVRPDGTVRHVENHGFPVHDERGHTVRMAGIVRDVTEQRQLQEELRVAQKLESVGQLAAGIAHEINTPAQYVSDNIAFLADALQGLRPLLEGYQSLLDLAASAGGDPARLGEFKGQAEKADLDFLLEEMPAALTQSRHGIDQIKKIVLAMKDFSHPGDTKEHANLNKGIESTVTVARNEWKYVAEVELDLAASLPPVPCVPSAINQAVLNIVVNGAHAIADVVAEGEKGKITIRTRATEADAIIEIEDTGGGIPDDIRERIFDPFFTTKEVGKGTGQGLAIVYAVIKERHGGSISVESVSGVGTCFTITLPLIDSAEEVAA